MHLLGSAIMVQTSVHVTQKLYGGGCEVFDESLQPSLFKMELTNIFLHFTTSSLGWVSCRRLVDPFFKCSLPQEKHNLLGRNKITVTMALILPHRYWVGKHVEPLPLKPLVKFCSVTWLNPSIWIVQSVQLLLLSWRIPRNELTAVTNAWVYLLIGWLIYYGFVTFTLE